MILTKYTDISVRVLMHLALNPNELGTISDIANRYNISRHHLVKVVHQLALNGYIRSTQGRGGGIELAYEPGDICLGEIVRLMESTLDIVDCSGYQCPLEGHCILKGVLNEATDAFMAVLDSYTVADLIDNRRELIKLIG